MPTLRLCGATVIGAHEAGDYHQQGGFSGSRRTEQRKEFTGVDF
jgi:hypothetical protein